MLTLLHKNLTNTSSRHVNVHLNKKKSSIELIKRDWHGTMRNADAREHPQCMLENARHE